MHRVDDGSALTVSFNTKTSVKPNLKTLKATTGAFPTAEDLLYTFLD